MEVAYLSNQPNGNLPILDLEGWVEDGTTVLHQFFKKTTSWT